MKRPPTQKKLPPASVLPHTPSVIWVYPGSAPLYPSVYRLATLLTSLLLPENFAMSPLKGRFKICYCFLTYTLSRWLWNGAALLIRVLINNLSIHIVESLMFLSKGGNETKQPCIEVQCCRDSLANKSCSSDVKYRPQTVLQKLSFPLTVNVIAQHSENHLFVPQKAPVYCDTAVSFWEILFKYSRKRKKERKKERKKDVFLETILVHWKCYDHYF